MRNILQLKIGKIILIFPIILMTTLSLVIAKTNFTMLRGKITDKDSGTPLVGTYLRLLDEKSSTMSNKEGKYVIRHLLDGNYTILVNHPGYQSDTFSVEISDQKAVRKDVELKASDLQLEGFWRGQLKNHLKQRQTLYHNVSIPEEQIDMFGDYNIIESLSRLPGVQIRQGIAEADTLAIRGVDMTLNQVMVDGIPVISQTIDNRFVNLAGMDGKMFSDIELIKLSGPDRSSHDNGGVINLRTSQPVSDDPSFSISSLGNYNDISNKIGSINSFRYSQKIGDMVGISTQGYYRDGLFQSKGKNINWNAVEQNQDTAITVGKGSFWKTSRNIERYGISGKLSFEPTISSDFFISGFYNNDKNSITRRNLIISSNTESYDISETNINNLEVNNGELILNPRFNNYSNSLYMLNTGGKLQLKLFNFDYSLSMSEGEYITNKDRSINMTNDSVNYTINNNNFNYPEFGINGEGYNNFNNYELTSNIDRNPSTNNKLYYGDLNIEIPVYIHFLLDTKIKFGGSYERRQISRGNDLKYYYSENPELDSSSFNYVDSEGWQNFGNSMELDKNKKYPIINPSGWDEWLGNNKNTLSRRSDIEKRSLSKEYEVEETSFGGYLMGEVIIAGHTKITGGVKLENIQGAYTGNIVNRVDPVSMNFAGDTTINKTKHIVSPSVFIQHNFTEQTILNVSLISSANRPNYNNMVPWKVIDTVNTNTIDEGNPDLEPIKGLKGQVQFKHIFNNGGLASVMFYFNERRNAIVREGVTIWDPEFAGVRSYKPLNAGDESHNFGAEATINSPLNFLPKPFHNLRIYSNFRYLSSLLQVDQLPITRTVTEPGVSRININAGLSYHNGGFSGMLLTRYTPGYIRKLSHNEFFEVDMDQYQESELITDLILTQRVFRNVSLLIKIKNLTNANRNSLYSELATEEDPFYNPEKMNIPTVPTGCQKEGMNIQAGVQINF